MGKSGERRKNDFYQWPSELPANQCWPSNPDGQMGRQRLAGKPPVKIIFLSFPAFNYFSRAKYHIFRDFSFCLYIGRILLTVKKSKNKEVIYLKDINTWEDTHLPLLVCLVFECPLKSCTCTKSAPRGCRWSKTCFSVITDFTDFKLFEASQPKYQHICNLAKNEFSPLLEVVASKLGLICPLKVLDVFGRKSKSKAPRSFFLLQNGYLLRLSTGENLVLIPQTIIEKLKF